MTLTNIAAIVAVIWHIEGGPRAVRPYGITSVPVRSVEHARRIATNTVRNNWTRWNDAGRPGCFYRFLARRYVGADHDPVGAENWERNMRRRIGHEKCNCHENKK